MTLTNPLIFPSLVPAPRARVLQGFRLNQGWSIEVGKAGERGGRLGDVRSFLDELYGPDLHAKRIDALAGATLGVMAAASLAVAMIGQALAQARGLVTKHAVKQVDRLLSNSGIYVWNSFARWYRTR